MKSRSEITAEIWVIGGSLDRHFEVPLWSIGDGKKMISRGCPSSALCHNGVDVDRFRACRIAFSPCINARGSISGSQRLRAVGAFVDHTSAC